MLENAANKGSHVIAAFGGMGKSHFARTYPSIAVDLEAVPYKYIYHRQVHLDALRRQDYEQLKGVSERIDNPAFPDNYVHDIVRNLGRYSFILAVLSPETLGKLEGLDVSYSIVYPEYAARDEIMQRMRQRGNSEAFLGKIGRLLSTEDEKETLLSSLHPTHFYTLGRGEYLQDLITREYGLGSFSPENPKE